MSLSRSEKRDHIIELIHRSKWTPGRTTSRLAREWHVDETEVHELWQEAMRAISVSGGGRAEYIAQKLAELDGIIQQATSLTKTMLTKDGDVIETPAPDLKAAVAAIKLQLETVGGPELGKLAAKKAADVAAMEDGAEKQYRMLTPAERIAKHEEAIQEERAKLEAKH